MNKIKFIQIVKDKKGNSTPLTIALILCILLLCCAMAEFFWLGIIVGGVRDGLQQAIITVTTTNYDETYNGTREGYSGGYSLSESMQGMDLDSWQENLDYESEVHNMKKDYNTKKKSTIIALSLTAICLAGGLFYYVGTLGNGELSTGAVESQPTTESQIVVPEIKPDGTQGSTDNSATISGTPSVDGDVQDKPSDGKPKTPEEATPPAEPPKTEDSKDKTPPKTPDTSKPDTDKNHEFTPENPSKPPEYKPEQTEPNNNTGKPKDGDMKDGKIYIEGFGWIEDEGENSQGGTDNGNKVGDM